MNNDNLLSSFSGEIIDPDSSSYEAAARSVVAAGSPAYVLRPRTVDDVQDSVRFARSADLALAVRGGGHSFAGFGTNHGGVVIDLCHLAAVDVVDREQHRVRIGGGATWGAVADALGPEGLAISSGDTRGVGVGGLTLSGGIGWKVRKYGLALDQLIAAEMVTAGGDVVSVSASENEDLFWAIRGGGGNVGIVTAFEFAAHPTTDVFHGKILFPSVEVGSVLKGWAECQRVASDDVTSIVNLVNPFAGGPEAPVQIDIVFDGADPELAASALDPFRRLGTVIEDDVELKPYGDVLEEGVVPPPGIGFLTRGAFVDPESVPDVVSILADVASTAGSPAISVRSVGAAVSRVPSDATAYAYRRAELMLATATVGPEPVIEAARPGVDVIWDRLAAHTNGAYANFQGSATEEDVAAIYPPSTYERLADLKRRYDPDNVFARNHNVRPR